MHSHIRNKDKRFAKEYIVMSRNIFHRILYNGKSLGLLLNKKRCGLFRIAIFIIFEDKYSER